MHPFQARQHDVRSAHAFSGSESDSPHPSGQGSFDTGLGIFDQAALRWFQTKLRCGVQEQVGCWFVPHYTVTIRDGSIQPEMFSLSRTVRAFLLADPMATLYVAPL